MFLDHTVIVGVTFSYNLSKGVNHLAGAWRHVLLSWPVPKEHSNVGCWCGRTECLESFISASGAKADHLASMETKLRGDGIAKATSQNDIDAESVAQALKNRVGQTTAMLISMLDPEIITQVIHLTNPNRPYVNVPRK